MNPQNLNLFCNIVRKLYSIEGLDQTDIDEMLFAYLTKNKLLPESWFELGEEFCEALNCGNIEKRGVAERIWNEYFNRPTENEILEAEREENLIYRQLIESQTGSCY